MTTTTFHRGGECVLAVGLLAWPYRDQLSHGGTNRPADLITGTRVTFIERHGESALVMAGGARYKVPYEFLTPVEVAV